MKWITDEQPKKDGYYIVWTNDSVDRFYFNDGAWWWDSAMYDLVDEVIKRWLDESPELSQPEIKAVKTAEEIYAWLRKQNYQTTYEETGEYKMYFEVDIPKIINDFTNQFSQPKESKEIEILKQENSYFKSVIAEINIQHKEEVEELKKKEILGDRKIVELEHEKTVLKSEVERLSDLLKQEGLG